MPVKDMQTWARQNWLDFRRNQGNSYPTAFNIHKRQHIYWNAAWSCTITKNWKFTKCVRKYIGTDPDERKACMKEEVRKRKKKSKEGKNPAFYCRYCRKIRSSLWSSPWPSSGLTLKGPCVLCTEDPKAGCSTPGGVSCEPSREGESPSLTSWFISLLTQTWSQT